MKDRVKPPLVRAWFDTVLNPVLQGLRTETAVLVRGDFTWRAHSRRFASLVPVRSHIMAEAWDNLDQFLSVYPELAPLIDDHDRNLQALHDRASEYHIALATNPRLREAILPLVNAAGPREDTTDFAEIVAEYVVNGITHLPNYYSTAQFWNAHARELLGLTQNPEFHPLLDSMQAAASEFKSALERLTMALMSVRNELSLEQGVPIVTGVAS